MEFIVVFTYLSRVSAISTCVPLRLLAFIYPELESCILRSGSLNASQRLKTQHLAKQLDRSIRDELTQVLIFHSAEDIIVKVCNNDKGQEIHDCLHDCSVCHQGSKIDNLYRHKDNQLAQSGAEGSERRIEFLAVV